MSAYQDQAPAVGHRLCVYYKDDDEWYPGTIHEVQHELGKGNKPGFEVIVVYDDGDRDALHLPPPSERHPRVRYIDVPPPPEGAPSPPLPIEEQPTPSADVASDGPSASPLRSSRGSPGGSLAAPAQAAKAASAARSANAKAAAAAKAVAAAKAAEEAQAKLAKKRAAKEDREQAAKQMRSFTQSHHVGVGTQGADGADATLASMPPGAASAAGAAGTASAAGAAGGCISSGAPATARSPGKKQSEPPSLQHGIASPVLPFLSAAAQSACMVAWQFGQNFVTPHPAEAAPTLPSGALQPAAWPRAPPTLHELGSAFGPSSSSSSGGFGGGGSSSSMSAVDALHIALLRLLLPLEDDPISYDALTVEAPPSMAAAIKPISYDALTVEAPPSMAAAIKQAAAATAGGGVGAVPEPQQTTILPQFAAPPPLADTNEIAASAASTTSSGPAPFPPSQPPALPPSAMQPPHVPATAPRLQQPLLPAPPPPPPPNWMAPTMAPGAPPPHQPLPLASGMAMPLGWAGRPDAWAMPLAARTAACLFGHTGSASAVAGVGAAGSNPAALASVPALSAVAGVGAAGSNPAALASVPVLPSGFTYLPSSSAASAPASLLPPAGASAASGAASNAPEVPDAPERPERPITLPYTHAPTAAAPPDAHGGRKRELPPGWRGERHETEKTSYMMYVGPAGQKVRTIKLTWERHAEASGAADASGSLCAVSTFGAAESGSNGASGTLAPIVPPPAHAPASSRAHASAQHGAPPRGRAAPSGMPAPSPRKRMSAPLVDDAPSVVVPLAVGPALGTPSLSDALPLLSRDTWPELLRLLVRQWVHEHEQQAAQVGGEKQLIAEWPGEKAPFALKGPAAQLAQLAAGLAHSEYGALPPETRALALQQLCEWALPSAAVTPKEAFEELGEMLAETRKAEREAREARDARGARAAAKDEAKPSESERSGAAKGGGAKEATEAKEAKEATESKESSAEGKAHEVEVEEEQCVQAGEAKRGEDEEKEGEEVAEDAAEAVDGKPAHKQSKEVHRLQEVERRAEKVAEIRAAKRAQLEEQEALEAEEAAEQERLAAAGRRRCLQARVRTELLGHDRNGSAYWLLPHWSAQQSANRPAEAAVARGGDNGSMAVHTDGSMAVHTDGSPTGLPAPAATATSMEEAPPQLTWAYSVYLERLDGTWWQVTSPGASSTMMTSLMTS